MSDSSPATPTRPNPMAASGRRAGRYQLVIPLVAFAALFAVFAWGLTKDPGTIPSVLIGKPVPTFDLPAVKGRTLGLSSRDLRGEVSLVNVFASWCTACRAEHPIFMRLHADGTVPIHGLNYKDEPVNAERWLNTLGDPYTRTGADIDGRIGIDWGVYGVPETFVIGKDGHVAYKQIGPITEAILERDILPLVRRLRAEQ